LVVLFERSAPGFLIPIRFKVSHIRLLLILRSKGDSVAMDELRLTSMSHGFRSESMRMSNPSISKQFVRCTLLFFIAVTI